jgi:hypothetical protein
MAQKSTQTKHRKHQAENKPEDNAEEKEEEEEEPPNHKKKRSERVTGLADLWQQSVGGGKN